MAISMVLDIEFLLQCFGHGTWYELAYVLAMAGQFADDRRIEIGVLLVRHEKDRGDRRREFAVHQRHLEFVFEITERAQAADDRGGISARRIFDEQTLKRVGAN